MEIFFYTLQVLSALGLSALILIQNKGTGLGRAFGGGGVTSFKRRGLERVIFKLTFIFTAVYLGVSILQIYF